jgi:hypothetical protein
MTEKPTRAPITTEEARKRRNIATALAIAGFMVIIFFVTMARIKANLGG